MVNLDNTDIQILKELIENSNLPIKELAQKVNLSISPVYERIKKLESNGIITKYTTLLNLDALDYNLVVYMQIKLIRHQDEIFKEFSDYIKTLEEVVEASFTAGEFDVMLKILLKDMDEYHNFILQKISKLDIILNVKSSFAIKNIIGKQFYINANNLY